MLKGQRAFISGASSGIGLACAELFAAQGVNLVLVARRYDRLLALQEKLQKEYRVDVKLAKLDVRHQHEMAALAQELERDGLNIEILINNAGLALGRDKIQTGQYENWDIMIDTNIKGLLYATRALLPAMIKRNRGHIINLGSIAGRECYPGGNVYCATKFAVRALSKSLRFDLSGTALRVSEIAPGAVVTEFSDVRFQNKDQAKKVYEGFLPLTAKDIAETVLFCANRPAHVNIEELVICPQAQAAVHLISRQEL